MKKRRIFYYAIQPSEMMTILMPKDARILSVLYVDTPVAPGGGRWRIYALVDPDAVKEKRRFAVLGTGWEVDELPGRFIGSATDGTEVYHVFEI
jgi:hypothetical protein